MSLLREISGSVGTKKFISKYWPHTPFFSHGRVGRFGALAKISEFQSLDNLLSSWSPSIPVRAWAPPQMSLGQNIETFNMKQAKRQYNKGFTLYFHYVEKSVPALNPILRSFERDLCLLPGMASCLGFASPPGNGAGSHFDPNLVFNFQLRGKKKWSIARNTTAPFPLFRENGSTQLQGQDEEMGEMPSTPDWEVETAPGSVVFVPHGYWHKTIVNEESFAIAFVIDPLPWGQVLTNYIWSKMSRKLANRELCLFHPERDTMANFKKRLNQTAADAKSILDHISVEEVLSQIRPGETYYRLRPNLVVKVETISKMKTQLKIATGKNKRESIIVGQEMGILVNWIVQNKNRFSESMIVDQIFEISHEDIANYIDQLVQAGIVEPKKIGRNKIRRGKK